MLNSKTCKFFNTVEKHNVVPFEYMFPNVVELQGVVRSKRLSSFYEDGYQECSRVKEVRPLMRALKGLCAWITEQRKYQSSSTKAEVPIVQVDLSFERLDSEVDSLMKWNPMDNALGLFYLANMREKENKG